MVSGNAKVIMGILLALAGWAYVPPIGREVELPDLEPLLDPGVPHGKPVFINTGPHVYYCVRLDRPVAPWFSWTYLDQLRLRGVQMNVIGGSAFAPFSWLKRPVIDVALAREKSIKPYTIEYWKSSDYVKGSLPASMRWPWLYYRLSSDVLQPPRVVVLEVPPADVTKLAVDVPRYPGSKLVRIWTSGWNIDLDFVVDATPQQVMEFYGAFFQQPVSLVGPEGQRDYKEFFAAPTALAASLMLPNSGHRVDVWVENSLLDYDAPISIYPRWLLPIPAYVEIQQPAMLSHLPNILKYRVGLIYDKKEEAVNGMRRLVPSYKPGISR